jgi:hypothetical protein
MGADFMFWLVPAPDLTPERQAELRRLADAATLQEETYSHYEDEREWRAALHAALDYTIEGHRDMAHWFPDPAPDNPLTYPVWLTGGLSCGDLPTEASHHFQNLIDYKPIYTILLKWAQEDNIP